MIISKQNRRTIYMALFQEGVLVAPKNFEIKHPNLDVPNLEVIKALQSLDSKRSPASQTPFHPSASSKLVTSSSLSKRRHSQRPRKLVSAQLLRQARGRSASRVS